MNLFVFFALFALIMLFNVYIGLKAGAQDKNTEDYFLGSRNLGTFSLVATIVATQVGGGTLIGACEEAYHRGYSVLFYPLGVVLGLLILSFQLGKTQRDTGLCTIPEVFEKYYHSPLLRKLASGICLLSLTTILIGQGIAANKFFFTLGFQSSWVFIFFWSLVVVYTAFGGLKAVVQTDICQVVFLFFSLLACFLYLFFSQQLKLPDIQLPTNSASSAPLFSWLFMPMLYMLIEQDMAQRCFAAKNAWDIPKACRLSALWVLLCVIPAIAIGFSARALALPISGSDCLLCEFVLRTCPSWLSLIVNCGILIAVISTADSLICSISSLCVYDFFSSPRFKGKKEVLYSQLCTLLLGLSCMGLSLYFTEIVTLLILAYEMAVCSLMASVLMALMAKRQDTVTASLSIALGLGSFIIIKALQAPSESLLLAILLSFTPFFTFGKTAKAS